MSEDKKSFRHQSLVYPKQVRELLRELSDGFDKGKVSFSDDDQAIEMKPKGLLNLKVTASREDNYHRMNIRVSWEAEVPGGKKKRKLTISSK